MPQESPAPLSKAALHNETTAALQGLPEPIELARQLRHLPGFLFLDSVPQALDGQGEDLGCISLLAACPEKIIRGNLFRDEDFERLSAIYLENLESEDTSLDLGFPLDGLYGTISYDGDFALGLYPEVLAYHHASGQWKEKGSLSQRRVQSLESPANPATPEQVGEFSPGVSRSEFCRLVETAQEYIAAGDIYQVNLSHQFVASMEPEADLFPLYERLRDRSPAPFSAFLRQGEKEILSSSPEEFLSISGRTIRTRPIKGTRPRFRDRELDEKSAYDLITSSKEVAELIMITDLERNDLGQICEFGTVEATELLKLERFAQVFHLVSTVEGTLRPEVTALDAIRACFPGGSITGAPKKRAREIIDELEPIPRGLYTGAIGGFGFNRESRFNIAIRTAIREDDTLHFHVGAGIVADSVPEMEWEETLHKASGLLQAFGSPE
ncbi:MAG: anthranilate synthase component I family protein [Verrucomicrobiales bacterium]|nr:anthranilate synthase component I family protein [Verrucomicrobiales bacterium]